MEPKLFVATRAFIVKDGKVLVVRESSKYADGVNSGKFDLPGGRVQPGERFDEGLVREAKEETGLSVKMGKPFFVMEWYPVVREEPWQIVGIFFECEAESDKVVLSADHDQYNWIVPAEYKTADLIPNLFPAFEAYLKR